MSADTILFDMDPETYLCDLRDRLMRVPAGFGIVPDDIERIKDLLHETVAIRHLNGKQKHDIREHVGGLAPNDREYNSVPRGGWHCFHCGAHFVTVKGAELHFGKTPDAVARCVADAGARMPTTTGTPVVTFNVEVDREGNIANDTQTHGNSFAEVYAAFPLILAEVQRQIDERRNCPFNPAYGQTQP